MNMYKSIIKWVYSFVSEGWAETQFTHRLYIGNCKNVRGLGKSKVVFRLFEKPRYSSERSTKFESLYQEYKYLEEENDKMEAL